MSEERKRKKKKCLADRKKIEGELEGVDVKDQRKKGVMPAILKLQSGGAMPQGRTFKQMGDILSVFAAGAH